LVTPCIFVNLWQAGHMNFSNHLKAFSEKTFNVKVVAN
jgi:hypothetical protein